MSRWIFALLLVLLTVLPARAAQLTIFAAASLTEVTRTLATAFTQTRPDVRVAISTAASGTLLRRMNMGEKADVFLSADIATMDTAVAQRRVDPDTRFRFAGNALVMATPPGNPAGVTDLDSLMHGGVRRVGVGNPESVPAGRYAKRALHKKALWFALTGKLVYYPSVRHVLTALADDKVDAGFIYRTDALLKSGTVQIVATIPLDASVTYVAARCAGSHDPQTATAFLHFLRTPAAHAILTRFGFSVP